MVLLAFFIKIRKRTSIAWVIRLIFLSISHSIAPGFFGSKIQDLKTERLIDFEIFYKRFCMFYWGLLHREGQSHGAHFNRSIHFPNSTHEGSSALLPFNLNIRFLVYAYFVCERVNLYNMCTCICTLAFFNSQL